MNFGIGGDKTQHVLWRVLNGELNFEIKPKIVVLLVGTNNFEHTADQVADGIINIVIEIRKQLENTHIIVVAIPPRGRDINIVREKIFRINELVQKNLPSQTNYDKLIHYACFSEVHDLVNPQDGTISHTDMFDYLHFTDQGYIKFVKPIYDEINEILSLYQS